MTPLESPRSSLPVRWRRWRAVLPSNRGIAIGFVSGVCLSLVGPLGTFQSSIGSRLAFWLPLLLLGTILGSLVSDLTSRRLRRGENLVWRWAMQTALIALPMGLVSWGLSKVLFESGMPEDLLSFCWAALLVAGPMTALMIAINTPGAQTSASPIGRPKLYERLPHPLRNAELLAVRSEDHYLRVFTSAGEALILLRLADAISELDGVDGAQIHRSWWVAKGAVARTEQAGRKYTLILKSGLQAPISRANVSVLRESGWLGE